LRGFETNLKGKKRNLSPRLVRKPFFTTKKEKIWTVTPSLVSEGGAGQLGWPVCEYDSASSPDQAATSPTNRLKRITNTDAVYTMCQTPEGPKFQCALCARVFNLKCTLLRHVRHQHQGRFVPHPCKTCGQVFKRTDHLKVHMKKIHNLSGQSPHHPPALAALAAAGPDGTVVNSV
jgi:uncharacterized C2H2 Zn-finger protein